MENDHTRPAWSEAEKWRLSAEPIVRIGSAEGDTTQALIGVRNSRFLSDSNIAIVCAGAGEVRIFDPQGRYIRTIGRPGDGPGEFHDPWALFSLPGDSILVIDLDPLIFVFAGDGRFVRQSRLARGEVPLFDPEPVGRFADGTLLFRARLEGPRQWNGTRRTRIQMLRHGHDGELLGSLGDFDDQAMSQAPRYQGPVMFGAAAHITASDSTMWYGPGDRFELREIALDTRTVRIVRLDRPARAVSDADKSAVYDDARARSRGTGREQALEQMIQNQPVAAVFPAHGEMRLDAAGHLWVQDYLHPRLRRPLVWSVFDRDGRYLGTVETPAGFYVHQIGADFVLGRWLDELDVEYVLMYRLEKPAG